MADMDPDQAAALDDCDLTRLGSRVRAARLKRGMTQTRLAQRLGPSGLSVGYVSRIESGQRRPTAEVVDDLAAALDVEVDELLTGVSADEINQIRLLVDYAELALESGQPVEAQAQAARASEKAVSAGLEDLEQRIRFILARAHEAQGHSDEAILALTPLTRSDVRWDIRVPAAISLVRCHRDAGDYTRAIECGEDLLQTMGALDEVGETDSTGSAGSEEEIQLTLTLASAFYLRGDVAQAVRLCRQSVARAEASGSPTARASAYWNTSIVESKDGNVTDAVALAQRALALLQHGDAAGTRKLALLRSQLGIMLLRLDPPDLDSARKQLDLAAQELAWTSAGPVEMGNVQLAQARVQFLDGDPSAALATCTQIHHQVGALAPLLAAGTAALQGQVHAVTGGPDASARALERYRHAAAVLSGIGADREAARAWQELGMLLDQADEPTLARDAYRSATAALGLPTTPPPRPVARVTEAQRAAAR